MDDQVAPVEEEEAAATMPPPLQAETSNTVRLADLRAKALASRVTAPLQDQQQPQPEEGEVEEPPSVTFSKSRDALMLQLPPSVLGGKRNKSSRRGGRRKRAVQNSLGSPDVERELKKRNRTEEGEQEEGEEGEAMDEEEEEEARFVRPAWGGDALGGGHISESTESNPRLYDPLEALNLFDAVILDPRSKTTYGGLTLEEETNEEELLRLRKDEDDMDMSGSAPSNNIPRSASSSSLVIDLDALSSSDEDDDQLSGLQPASPHTHAALTIQKLKAQIAVREREQLMRKNSLTEAQMRELEYLDSAARLKKSKVSAQEELLRQLLDECKSIQKHCEDLLKFVEREIPARLAVEKQEIARLQVQLKEAEERNSQTIAQGQEASFKLRDAQQALASKKEHVGLLYERVVQGQNEIASVQQRHATLLQSRRKVEPVVAATATAAAGDDTLNKPRVSTPITTVSASPNNTVTVPELTRKQDRLTSLPPAARVPDALSALLGAAKQRAAVRSKAELKVPWPPIAPQQARALETALTSASDFGTLAAFDRLWLRSIREASAAFRNLAIRMANHGDQYTGPPGLYRDKVQEKPSLHTTYTSPLLALRSYRVSSNFASTLGDQIWHPTFSNSISPNTPLCRFEMGSGDYCNNKDCPFLHRRDYEIPDGMAVLQDLGRYATPIQVEEARATLQTLADGMEHEAEEVYGVWSTVSRMLARGVVMPSLNGPVRSDTVARTSYMSSSTPNPKKGLAPTSRPSGEDPEDEETGRSKGEGRSPVSDGNQRGDEPGFIGLVTLDLGGGEMDDGDAGEEIKNLEHWGTRHGGVSRLPLHSTEAFVAEEAVPAAVERIATEAPHDVDAWLRLVRCQIEQPSGSLYQAAVALTRALVLNEESAPLWVVYVCIYLRLLSQKDSQRITEEDEREEDALFESAVKHCPGCLTLWFIWVERKHSFPQRDAICKRAMVALSDAQALEIVNSGSLSRNLSVALMQMLLFRVQLLCDSDMRVVALNLLEEWCQGNPVSLVGPHHFAPQDHVSLLLIWLSLVMDPEEGRSSSLPSWVAPSSDDYILLSMRTVQGQEPSQKESLQRLLAGLQAAEASVMTRGYSMHHILPLRVNRICAAIQAGDRSLAVGLFKELQAFCPHEADVQSLSAALLPQSEPNPSDSRFVSALGSMVKALSEGEAHKAVLAIPQKAASHLVFAMSAQQGHLAKTLPKKDLFEEWKRALGVDVHGVDLVLRSERRSSVPLTAPELVCSYLCLIIHSILEGGPNVFPMFEDALYFTRSLGPRFQAPIWMCYLAFASGLSHASCFDSLMPRARHDLLFAPLPEPWLARIVPSLPQLSFTDSVCRSWTFFCPRDSNALHNMVSQPVLESLPRLARRKMVADMTQLHGNTTLASWCIQKEMMESEEVTTQAVLAWAALMVRACKAERRENPRSRWVWFVLEGMLGRNQTIVQWMLDRGRKASLFLPLWMEVLHAVQSLKDEVAAGKLRTAMLDLFGSEQQRR